MSILNEIRDVVGSCYRKHTKRKNQLLAVVAIGLLAGPMSAQAQARYDFQVIDHPGTPLTQVFGINDRGHVVGIGFIGDTPFPFVYKLKKGTLTDVAPAPGYAGTGILGINDSGVMVGSVTSLDFSTESGLIRKKDGTDRIFSHPEAVSFTQGRAINNRRLVSGIRDTADSLASFIYDPKTEAFTDIVPSLFTLAHGINSKGEVVGEAWFFVGPDDPCDGSPIFEEFVSYSWLRAKDGSITYFQVNGLPSRARGINDAGFITGAVDDFDAGTAKGFVAKLDGNHPCESLTIDEGSLLVFPGFDFTVPEGINNSGKVVGIAIDETSHGFIATPRRGKKKRHN